VAGMMAPTEAMGDDVPPHWGMYCTVDDVDLTAALVEELGGTLCVPTMDIPEIGRVCGITSPQGVMFYAITYLPRGAN
ncbi:MAG: VOC family protein, partial [Gemmatimonadota bacterium]